MEYLYPTHYDRDYTPTQAREFLNQVQACLVPLARYDAIWNCEPANWYLPSGQQALEKLSHVA